MFQIFLRRDTNRTLKKNEEFIKAEQEAAFSRAKDIEEEKFITVNIERFPLMEQKDIVSDEDKYAYSLQKAVLERAAKKMLHFEESNIDLKRMYGAGNLEFIIQYEENYTEFLRKLNSWAKALADADRKDSSIKILEYGIELGLDYTRSFILLADLYKEKNDISSLRDLYELTSKNESIAMDKVNSHIKNLIDR